MTAELIERLEQAEGPSPELDEAIFQVVFGDQPLASPGRRFTSSVDAALTLVPEGWDWAVSTSTTGPDVAACFFASVRETQPFDPVTLQWPDRPDAEGFKHHKGGPALALCIASLKARLSVIARG